jgi:hypothetical protein
MVQLPAKFSQQRKCHDIRGGDDDMADRIRQDVDDIGSADQLLRYALAGQLERVHRRRGFSQGEIAQGAGLSARGGTRSAGSAISRDLQNGGPPLAEHLPKLDEIIGALSSPELIDTGTLSSLALRLSRKPGAIAGSSPLGARIPPSWTSKILADQPRDEVEVLLQASALLSEFIPVGNMGTANTSIIQERYSKELNLLVNQLIVTSIAPPTSRNLDAQILLGMLGRYALEPMMKRLDSQVRYSPMGFRVWRAITKLVMVAEGSEHADTLANWVRELIADSERLRHFSLYPGGGLDLELAIIVPAAWSPPGDDWVNDALLARARNWRATLRERGTAAMGVWQRAVGQGRAERNQAKENLRRLIPEFRDPVERPELRLGLGWLAATLEQVIDAEVAVCNEWPEVDEEWFRHVQAAADELGRLDIPEHLADGTKNLFRHMILQNAGVHRREAIETVVTSGWTKPVAMALSSLLRTERDEAWVRIRAEVALGSLQRHNQSVETDLANACEHAYRNLQRGESVPGGVPRADLTEMHASLFAVGDCFGVTGAEEQAMKAREKLRHILIDVATAQGERAKMLRRPARAVAYLLTATAQPTDPGSKDLSQDLLEKMSRYPDPSTARLSRWALSFRFAHEGKIRPFLAAADHAGHDDIPWSE